MVVRPPPVLFESAMLPKKSKSPCGAHSICKTRSTTTQSTENGHPDNKAGYLPAI
jgi:hypothetical protein